MSPSPARHVFGLAAIASGVVALFFHHYDQLNGIPHQPALTPCVAAIQILGGIAVQWRRFARVGAIILGAIFIIFTFLTVPSILAHPAVYNSYGNFFEQFSLVSGALILFALKRPNHSSILFGRCTFALCTLSFALEQLFYLRATADFVPTWMPLGQRFWAIATTAFFALAALALLAGVFARLAAQCTAAMLACFALLVWAPIVYAHPNGFFNWSEAAETAAIAAAAWMLASLLTVKPAVQSIR